MNGSKIPVFEPQIPDELMAEWHNLTPVQRCLLKEQSLQRQQMAWVITRLAEGDVAIGQLKQDVDAIKRLRDILTAKWSVIAFIVLSIVFPIIGLLASSWFSKAFHKP